MSNPQTYYTVGVLDLSSIFQPLSLGTQYSTATGFKVGSQDFNEIFAKYPGSGAPQAAATGFKIGSQDLNLIFAKYNPVSVPGAPTGLNLTSGNAQIVTTWIAPSSDGGSAITSYRVNWSGGNFVDTGNTSTSYTITGLNYGTNYTVNVQAVNSLGRGQASSIVTTTTLTTVPSVPLNFSLTSGNAQIVARWSDPATTGGLPITFQIYYAPPDTVISNILSTDYIITNLSNGTSYNVYVLAYNTNGPGEGTSPPLSATPATVPSAPPRPGGRPDVGVMNLTWQAPYGPPYPSDGGSPIISYRLIAQGNGREQTHDTNNNTQFSYTWYLERGSYNFYVEAINSVPENNGVGARSPLSSAFVS